MNDRYFKQRAFLGSTKELLLRQKRVVIVGIGATGSVIASWLARAGVGHLTLIDRDIVELSNLHRQILFTENDLSKSKAEVASLKLKASNTKIDIEAKSTDLTSGNAKQLLNGFDLILDGTDNLETRFLINDYSFITETPWIYSGVIGSEGMIWPICPPKTSCLRCLIKEPPSVGDIETCDSRGVLGPAVGIIGSWASMEALKILTGDSPSKELSFFNFWHNERQFIQPPSSKCRFCSEKITDFLDAKWTILASKLCGLEGVQIRVNPPGNLDLLALSNRFEQYTGNTCRISSNTLSGYDKNLKFTVFKDGRVLIYGSITLERARSWYAHFIGS